MARNDALLKLHKRLVDRRNALRAVLTREVDDLNISDRAGDEADAAFDSGADEISCSLAEIEGRELSYIEKAISKLKHGTYGICEHCQRRIPVARLNALPYSVYCMPCQREMEKHPHDFNDRIGSSWEKVYDNARRYSDEPTKLDLAALEKE